MRLLVACSACSRQYDATDRAIGSRFRCHCGNVVAVEEPKAHEARVVRCSSCGGPRAKDAKSCAYCGSDFTLRERDLNTICPQCFARVSDRAQFCPQCATPIVPEDAAGETTDLGCPACGSEQRLRSRELGPQLSSLECERCTGLWLSADAFSRLEDEARRGARTEVAAKRPESARPLLPLDPAAGPTYRPCPRCSKLMLRQNYGRRSGVVIDVCKTHGVWFDGDELEAVLAWVRDGGLERSRQRDRDLEAERDRAARVGKVDVSSLPPYDLGDRKYRGLGSFLGETLLDVVLSIGR